MPAGGARQPGRSRRALARHDGAGADARRVRAFLGPAVAPERYQVSDEVRRALSGAVRRGPLDAAVARPDGPGHWLVDLVAANRQQLWRPASAPTHVIEQRRHHGRRRLLQRPGAAALRAVRPAGALARLSRCRRRVRRSMGRPGPAGPPHLRCLPTTSSATTASPSTRRARSSPATTPPTAHSLHRALHVRAGRRLGRPGGRVRPRACSTCWRACPTTRPRPPR